MRLITMMAAMAAMAAAFASGQADQDSPAADAGSGNHRTRIPASEASIATPTTATAIGTGRRYVDGANGFSLCPPLNTERSRLTSARRLVAWTRRDEQSGAIRWTLEVLRTSQKPSKLPISQYAKAVAKELAKANKFHVESTSITTVAGKPAIHFRGLWKGAFTLWRRQTWVRIEPGKHLVLDIAGPVADKDEMDSIMTAVVDSLRLFDPEEAISRQQEELDRGSAVLEGLTAARLQSILADQTCYFTIKLGGRTVGFLEVTETMTTPTRSDPEGLRIVRRGAVNIPNQPKRLIWEELFTTADRTVERWKQITIEPRGASATRNVLAGTRRKDIIRTTSTSTGQPARNRQTKLPSAISAAYLPQAMGVLAARLIDRSKPARYGFAVYNLQANDFNPQTITVVGPEKIELSGKEIAAVHLTDRMAPGDPTAHIWVDEKGIMLRMKTGGAMTMERSDRKSIAAAFAAELRELERIAPGQK